MKIKYQEVYVVLRWDDFVEADPEDAVTVKEILPTRDEAESEVQRLNAMQKPRKKYFWRMGRLLRDGLKGERYTGG